MEREDFNIFLNKMPFLIIIWKQEKFNYIVAFTNKKEYMNMKLDQYVEKMNLPKDDFYSIVHKRDELTIKQKDKIIYLNKINDEYFFELHQPFIDVNDYFLKMISHKIRNPLSSIIGVINLLDNSGLDEQQKKYLNMIKKASYELIVVANDIIDVVNFGNKKVKFSNDAVDLKRMIEECLGNKRSDFEKKRLSLKFNYDDKIPSMIFSDESRLRQVFDNLLKNSIKFTNIGGITVDVDIFDEDLSKIYDSPFQFKKPGDNEMNIVIKIKDTGSGIEKDTSNIIREIFNIKSTDHIKAYKTPGFGLLICRYIVNQMNGHIWFKSEIDMGTVFYFNFICKKL